MELEENDFIKLCKYYHVEFNTALEYLDTFIKDVGVDNIANRIIYLGIVPNIIFPPSALFKFDIGEPSTVLKIVGYFNISRYIKNNSH